jgi:phytoene dehydrogenase-like protein
MTENKKVIIVGGGMAGLTAAAYLTRDDFNVLLLEKNERTGGLVHTFEQNGFFYDSGPRAFVNSGMVQPILRDLGISGDYLENLISLGIEEDLVQVESMDSLAAYQQMLEKYYPENTSDISKIIAEMEKLSGYTQILYEFDNPNFVDIMSDKKFIFRELIPWTFKFLIALRKMNKYHLPMEDFLADLTDNQSLKDILTQYFFRKTPTHFALGYFYVYQDYFYPRGGTGVLPNNVQEKILESGGKIELNTEVTKVIPSEKQVLVADGQTYKYDHLIWAADLKTLYKSLDTQGLSTDKIRVIETEKEQILEGKGAESVFILFLGVDRPPSYFQDRGGPHWFFSPSRVGLGDTHLGKREELLKNFESKTKEEVLGWLDDFCELNSYEVSVPALRDPSLAPEGQTGIMISCLFDFDLFEKIEKAGWYDEFKQTMEERIIDVFSQSIYQGFKEDILDQFSSTPLTINRFSGSSEGAIVGWSFESEVPVINKLQDIPKSVLTPIPDVYQAGQWSYVPAGVPIAMLTGWYAYQKIIKG